jgi:hypothetical protein
MYSDENDSKSNISLALGIKIVNTYNKSYLFIKGFAIV